MGRFLSVDPGDDADALSPQSWNKFTYVRNNPINRTDPTGEFLETLWDAGNAIYGVVSAVQNVRAGNYGSAAIDVGGAIVDGLAAAVPFVPGGAGAAIKGARLANKVDNALDGSKAVRKAPAPNGGIAKPHGGGAHNSAIDGRIDSLRQDPSVSNIRKNQAQTDVSGNKVGNNRPDVQFDQNGTHTNVEYDTSQSRGSRHGKQIRKNDPNARVELNRVEKDP